MAPHGKDSLTQYQLDLNAARRRDFLSHANNVLKESRARLVRACHKYGGFQSCRRYTGDMDALLLEAHDWLATMARLAEADYSRIALIAQGGFGRSQLSLYSDLDLLFLMPDAPTPVEHAFIKSFLYLLWDLNKLDIGYATKRPGDILGAVGTDFDSTTSLAETRLIFGNARAHSELVRRLEKLIRGSARKWFIESVLKEIENRHAKHDSSVYLLEPNIKDDEGGLRDAHSLGWLVYAMHGSADLNILVEKEVLSAGELDSITKAMDFMLAARIQLHSLEGRKVDTMTFDKQPRVAAAFGYKPDPLLLAEEKLMRDYYMRARDIDRFTQKARRILTYRARSVVGGVIDAIRRRSQGKHYYTKDGVQFHKKITADYFRHDPARVMECFHLACDSGTLLSDELKDLLIASRDALDAESFRASPQCRDLFMSILGHKHNAARTIHAMHETGILADYLPEFVKIFCMVRIDHYHRYTVDEHLIKTIEVSEALAGGQEGQPPRLTEAARQIPRWDLLNLALLLHDIGKGEGHGHVLRGASISERITQRMNLPPDDREIVRQLILLHLKMTHISQRRDLDDPIVIREMADTVQLPDMLRMLYVLTYCDTRAVGPSAWNDWKDALLHDLYRKTLLQLEDQNPLKPMDDTAMRKLAAQIVEIAGGGATGAEVARFLSTVQPKYLNCVSPSRMARHIRMLRLLNDDTHIIWETEDPPDLDYTEITTVSHDKPGFMALMCGALASKNVNILSVQAFSTSDGRIIDTFQVTDLRGMKLPHGFRLDRLRADLNKVLQGKAKAADVFPIKRRSLTVKADLDIVKPARVIFNNDESPNYTLLEVKAHDRPGLLYDLTSTCSEHGCNIHLAMITTEAYRVVDVFYLTDLDYNKLEPARLKKLQSSLEAVITHPAGHPAPLPRPG
ncbi:MAG: [protein-PII] uridylyltransferase [bacterium]|nr:[protein-PII] uridylyltransferase [Candidatus Sumerlaeota bacterium]